MSNSDEWTVVGKGGKPKGNKPKRTKTETSNTSTNTINTTNTTNTLHQDWNHVQFNKRNVNTIKVDKNIKNNSTQNSTTYFDSRKAKKIEELHESGDFSLEKCSKKLQNSIIQGRNNLGLSQEDFAKLCSIQVNVIKSYERGTLVPTNEHINIMSKKLGVTLSK